MGQEVVECLPQMSWVLLPAALSTSNTSWSSRTSLRNGWRCSRLEQRTVPRSWELLRTLSCHVGELLSSLKNTWHPALPEFRFARNTASHGTLKVSTAFLNFERNALSYWSSSSDIEKESQRVSPEPANWLDRVKRLDHLGDLINRNLGRAYNLQAKYNDDTKKRESTRAKSTLDISSLMSKSRCKWPMISKSTLVIGHHPLTQVYRDERLQQILGNPKKAVRVRLRQISPCKAPHLPPNNKEILEEQRWIRVSEYQNLTREGWLKMGAPKPKAYRGSTHKSC